MQKKSKFLSWLVFAAMFFTLLPVGAPAAQAVDESPAILDISAGDITINTGGCYIITQSNSVTETVYSITVADSVYADITLSGVNINATGKAAFAINDNARVNLSLEEGTENTLISSYDFAGLQMKSNSELVINGRGMLNATGGYGGAGIGGGVGGSGGNVTIEGGTVNAAGGGFAAGIGGGYGNNGGTVHISGGAITATGGNMGAGIGAGGSSAGENSVDISGGQITISGGTVAATGGANSAGIGGGGDNSSNSTGGSGGTISISGGMVTATGGRYSAGIGGGRGAAGGNITISGGTVTATGGTVGTSFDGINYYIRGGGGAGIGGGGTFNHNFSGGNGGTISITGGLVTAFGGYYAAGIGGGRSAGGGEITISGGTVTATGGTVGTKYDGSRNTGGGGAGIGGGGAYDTGYTGGSGALVIVSNNPGITATGNDGGEHIGRGFNGVNSGSLQDDSSRDLGYLRFQVTRQNNAAVSGATVTVNNNSYTTNSQGVAGCVVPRGSEATYSVNAGGYNTKTGSITPDSINNEVSVSMSRRSSGGSPSSPKAGVDGEDVPQNKAAWINPFTDVGERDWFYESVAYAVQNKLFVGTSDSTFSPDDNMTRAMLVTVLYRLAGEPDGGQNSFTDVSSQMWYADAVAWASEQGIISGYGAGLFGPEYPVTREQMAVILYNYARSRSYDLSATSATAQFADTTKVSGWAVDAIEWTVGAGLITGKDTGILDPQGNATRAQVAAILQRFVERYGTE